jgi:DNA replication and repair protein RecF
MWISKLSLTNFRNYRKQELELPRSTVLLLGDNAQGKSNLLEAVFLLATTKSDRAQTEGEVIRWEALDDAQPVARVAAHIERTDGPIDVEVIVAGRPRDGERDRVPSSKRLRLNGVAKRATDVVGQLTAVLFTTEDMELIGGAPALRRRFIDVALSQLDQQYARALSRYNKVITQRNALLRRIQEGGAKRDELDYWDEQVATDGALIMRERAAAIDALAGHARATHRELSGGIEELAAAYRPRLDRWEKAMRAKKKNALEDALLDALEAGRPRDVGAGMTLTGPHRDDLAFTLDGATAGSFGSRGQQRTAALALRLAEARLMTERRGDVPVVLLDDVLSELDESRRRAVLQSLGEWDQLIITSADADRFGEGLPAAEAAFRIEAGKATPLSS